MKTLLSIFLCTAMAVLPIQAQTNVVDWDSVDWLKFRVNDSGDNEPDTPLCWFIIGATLIGGAIVISVYLANPTCCSNKRCILLEDENCIGVWKPIATNDVYVCTKKTDIFSAVPRKDTARYRLQIGPLPNL